MTKEKMLFHDAKTSHPDLVHKWLPTEGDDPYSIYESDPVLLLVRIDDSYTITDWDATEGVVTGYAAKAEGSIEVGWVSHFDDEVGRTHEVIGWCEMPKLEV